MCGYHTYNMQCLSLSAFNLYIVYHRILILQGRKHIFSILGEDIPHYKVVLWVKITQFTRHRVGTVF